ncbi:hypothetical protein QE152_g607 [Popillia japonica]|uniref:Protein FMC1 homolog n=1 Tax=Popillia japonica TaxID=7064 RepID=A0AAW1NC62_POPJA
MSKNINLQDDFKLISHKRRNKKAANILKLTENITNSTATDYNNKDTAIRRIHQAKQDILVSDLYSSLLASLRESQSALLDPRITEIICLGLGRIDTILNICNGFLVVVEQSSPYPQTNHFRTKQYRKHYTTDEQLCKSREEMKFMANTYLCYLRSSRLHKEINEEFHGKGERSVGETASMLGFKLPHDPK